MPRTLPDILYNSVYKNKEVDSNNALYKLEFYKSTRYFENYDCYQKFLHAVENSVRTDDRYKNYISYLKKNVKLDKCQVYKNVTDEDATIEMHHGPVFTLFDICAIVLEYFIYKQWEINTFIIADAVLEEHEKNRVQVVMVSSTVHEQIHNGDIFINIHQAWGDLNAFVKKYECVLDTNDYIKQLNNYIDRSLLYDSTDFSVLDLNPKLYKKNE